MSKEIRELKPCPACGGIMRRDVISVDMKGQMKKRKRLSLKCGKGG